MSGLYGYYSEVSLPRHLVCEPCGPHVAGGFDPYRQQIVLCENNIYSQVIHTHTHCNSMCCYVVFDIESYE